MDKIVTFKHNRFADELVTIASLNSVSESLLKPSPLRQYWTQGSPFLKQFEAKGAWIFFQPVRRGCCVAAWDYALLYENTYVFSIKCRRNVHNFLKS